jgi:hypothetical protein
MGVLGSVPLLPPPPPPRPEAAGQRTGGPGTHAPQRGWGERGAIRNLL